MSKKCVLGIDFGYSAKQNTFAYSQWETREHQYNGVQKYTLHVVQQTNVTSLADFEMNVLGTGVVDKADLITLDAPITPEHFGQNPVSGRTIEHYFSRGDFANGKRGPQPSSIRVPKQGWMLYQEAMKFVVELSNAGFPLFHMPPQSSTLSAGNLEKRTVEVLPKLTMSLLTPKDRVSSRPPTKGGGMSKEERFYRQIDNWLFPHLFCAQPAILATMTNPRLPQFGLDSGCLTSLLGQNVSLDASVTIEADTIQAEANLDIRHEMIGAFVAGFQGALAFAGKSQFVGAEGKYEGYYLLPNDWHSDWKPVWSNSCSQHKGTSPVVYCLPVHP